MSLSPTRAAAQKYIEMVGLTGYENKYPLRRAFGGFGCTDKRLNAKRNRKKLHSEGVFIKAKADLVSVNGSYSGKIFGTEVTVSDKINIGF
ncbi:MAG: hypothetical protein LIO87_01575 [Eubacterium sp.]|nr:hypothetical protein [Eubacterium sp.]